MLQCCLLRHRGGGGRAVLKRVKTARSLRRSGILLAPLDEGDEVHVQQKQKQQQQQQQQQQVAAKLGSPTRASASPSLVERSHFARQLQRAAMQLGAGPSENTTVEASGARSPKQRPAATSLELMAARDAKTRELVAKHPEVRLPGGVTVPLLPASLLAVKSRDEDLTDQDRLHHAVQQNHLVRSSAKIPFRCLRCFTVFESVPREILDVYSSTRELQKKKEQMSREALLAEKPHLRRKFYSRSVIDREHQHSPTSCVKCGSTKVQWLMDYAHRSLHTGSAYRHNRSS